MNQTAIFKTSGFLALSLIITLLHSAEAIAQTDSTFTAEERATLLTEKQAERIDFEAGQQEKMYAINLKYAKEMNAIAEEGRSLSTLRKMREMSNRKDKEVKAVLDKDQYQAYLDLKNEMREEFKERRKNG